MPQVPSEMHAARERILERVGPLRPELHRCCSRLVGSAIDGKPVSDRTFKLAVSEVRPAKGMIWSDGFAPMLRGVRTFTLTPRGEGVMCFSRVERVSGLMLTMIGSSLPDFGAPFEQYALDLKKEAERTHA